MFNAAQKKSLSFRVIACFINFCFIFNFMAPVRSWAQSPADLGLPMPGTMINLTPNYAPMIVKGLKVHPENPLLFDFIVDLGQDHNISQSNTPEFREEARKLMKYFLASLTVPEENLWVNLSPYEKDRVIPQELGQTELGRDMLAQDYILKQMTASLIYPEKELGKAFWSKVYAKAKNEYGTTQMPVNTFNKVWIMAEKADVYVHDNTAFVVASHLKVMLEEDYLAMQKHSLVGAGSKPALKRDGLEPSPTGNNLHSLSSTIIRSVVLPALENEVNTGKHFANLRQIFHSMILATWYKKNLKEALLNQVYSNKAKINGVDVADKTIKEQIYKEYLKAYKKGVFNYIKEEPDPVSNQMTPRKYFSGGLMNLVMASAVDANNLEVGQFAADEGNNPNLVAIQGLASDSALPLSASPEMGTKQEAIISAGKKQRERIEPVVPSATISRAMVSLPATKANNILIDNIAELFAKTLEFKKHPDNEDLLKKFLKNGTGKGRRTFQDVVDSFPHTFKVDIRAALSIAYVMALENMLFTPKTKDELTKTKDELMTILTKGGAIESVRLVYKLRGEFEGGVADGIIDEILRVYGKEVSDEEHQRNRRIGTKSKLNLLGLRPKGHEIHPDVKFIKTPWSLAMISADEARSLGFSDIAVSNITDPNVIQDPRHVNILRVLANIGEQGLLSDWDAPGTNDDLKRSFLNQLVLKDQELVGGLTGYKQLVQNLLKNAKEFDPTEGYSAQVPQGKLFNGIDQDYLDYTNEGIDYLDQLALVKVAGGSGDRLAYNGPKVGIPVDLVTGKPFLQKDAEQILAKQRAYFLKTGKHIQIPLVIMTSDATHAGTIKLLQENNFYGLKGYSVADSTKEIPLDAKLGQVILIRQNMVPLVKDMNAGLYKENKYKLGQNARGHGDIHEMLYRSGLVKYFKAQGKGQLLFYQDTNVETWNAVLPLLANAVKRGDFMNLTTVKRKPGEATGIVMTLIGDPLRTKDLDKVSGGQSNDLLALLQEKGYIGVDNKVLKDTIDAQNNNIPGFEKRADQLTAVLKMVKARQGKVITRNVEYNYIKNSPALKKVESQYGGNINIFTMNMDAWLAAVDKNKGDVPFIINPKLKTGSETELIKPMRAENTMQDADLWFEAQFETLYEALKDEWADGLKVGVTSFDARLVFAALKNDYPETYKRFLDNVFLESPFAVEGIHYQNNRRMAAQMGGVNFTGAGVEGYQRTIPFEVTVKEGDTNVKKTPNFPWFDGAKFVYNPIWAPTILDFSKKLKGGTWTQRAVVDIEGENVVLNGVDVDGTLVVKAAEGVYITIDGLKVQNEGWSLDNLWDDIAGSKQVVAEAKVPQYLIQRGFQLVKRAGLVIDIQKPGRYTINSTGEVLNEQNTVIGKLSPEGINIANNVMPTNEKFAQALTLAEAHNFDFQPLFALVKAFNDRKQGETVLIDDSVVLARLLALVIGNPSEKLSAIPQKRQIALEILSQLLTGGFIDPNALFQAKNYNDFKQFILKAEQTPPSAYLNTESEDTHSIHAWAKTYRPVLDALELTARNSAMTSLVTLEDTKVQEVIDDIMSKEAKDRVVLLGPQKNRTSGGLLEVNPWERGFINTLGKGFVDKYSIDSKQYGQESKGLVEKLGADQLLFVWQKSPGKKNFFITNAQLFKTMFSDLRRESPSDALMLINNLRGFSPELFKDLKKVIFDTDLTPQQRLSAANAVVSLFLSEDIPIWSIYSSRDILNLVGPINYKHGDNTPENIRTRKASMDIIRLLIEHKIVEPYEFLSRMTNDVQDQLKADTYDHSAQEFLDYLGAKRGDYLRHIKPGEKLPLLSEFGTYTQKEFAIEFNNGFSLRRFNNGSSGVVYILYDSKYKTVARFVYETNENRSLEEILSDMGVQVQKSRAMTVEERQKAEAAKKFLYTPLHNSKINLEVKIAAARTLMQLNNRYILPVSFLDDPQGIRTMLNSWQKLPDSGNLDQLAQAKLMGEFLKVFNDMISCGLIDHDILSEQLKGNHFDMERLPRVVQRVINSEVVRLTSLKGKLFANESISPITHLSLDASKEELLGYQKALRARAKQLLTLQKGQSKDTGYVAANNIVLGSASNDSQARKIKDLRNYIMAFLEEYFQDRVPYTSLPTITSRGYLSAASPKTSEAAEWIVLTNSMGNPTEAGHILSAMIYEIYRKLKSSYRASQRLENSTQTVARAMTTSTSTRIDPVTMIKEVLWGGISPNTQSLNKYRIQDLLNQVGFEQATVEDATSDSEQIKSILPSLSNGKLRSANGKQISKANPSDLQGQEAVEYCRIHSGQQRADGSPIELAVFKIGQKLYIFEIASASQAMTTTISIQQGPAHQEGPSDAKRDEFNIKTRYPNSSGFIARIFEEPSVRSISLSQGEPMDTADHVTYFVNYQDGSYSAVSSQGAFREIARLKEEINQVETSKRITATLNTTNAPGAKDSTARIDREKILHLNPQSESFASEVFKLSPGARIIHILKQNAPAHSLFPERGFQVEYPDGSINTVTFTGNNFTITSILKRVEGVFRFFKDVEGGRYTYHEDPDAKGLYELRTVSGTEALVTTKLSQGRLAIELEVPGLLVDARSIPDPGPDAPLKAFLSPNLAAPVYSLLKRQGGISLNAKNMQMNERGDTINLHFNEAMVAQFRRGDFSGVRMELLGVVPIIDIRLMMGLKKSLSNEALAKA